MRTALVLALALLGASPAWAEDAVGCDKFKWPVERERDALARSDLARLSPGAEITTPLPMAAVMSLRPAAEAKLPSPPERVPKTGAFASFVTVGPIPGSGLYTISLSAYAWVDVIQNGTFLKPQAFSGATGCDGIRKVMKFSFAPGRVLIQLSGVSEDTVKIAVLPVPE